MQEIKTKCIFPVKEWNAIKRSEGQHMLVYTLGNGSIVDIPRKRGWVVQKRHVEGGERSRFHSNIEKAMEDYHSDKFN